MCFPPQAIQPAGPHSQGAGTNSAGKPGRANNNRLHVKYSTCPQACARVAFNLSLGIWRTYKEIESVWQE